MRHLLLRSPSANRVYAAQAGGVCAAELALTAPFATGVEPCRLAGVDYLGFRVEAGRLGARELAKIAAQSSAWALFAEQGDLLAPIELPVVDTLDEDLVTIPKYPGKTNEQFTRLLLNVTLAQTRRPPGRLTVLDPLCGRGTTLTTAWLAGCDAHGVEADPAAFDQMAAFLTTWLRRKRLKHRAATTPVRRDGRRIGRRFDAEVRPAGGDPLRMSVFTGDARDSRALFGRKRFDAVVADAPYGVAHGASQGGRRERSAWGLLTECVGVWASQLAPGGAMGLSWNTLTMPRESLAELMADAGLEVASGGWWERFAHRVDSSINRDLMVGVASGADARARLAPGARLE